MKLEHNNIHVQLEEIANSVSYGQKMITKIQSVFNEVLQTDSDAAKFVRYEIDFFKLLIKSNEIRPMFTCSDENGQPVYVPDVNEFPEEQWEYLILRAESAENVLLQVHYNHLAWLSPLRHINHAKKAVNSYFKLIEHYRNKNITDHTGGYWNLMVSSIKNCFQLGHSSGIQKPTIKGLVLEIATTLDLEDPHSDLVIEEIVGFMLEQKKYFKAKDFQNITDRLDNISKKASQDNLQYTARLVELIVKVESRLGNNLKPWYEILGQLWEQITLQRKDGSFVTTDFCRTAIGYYLKSGNEAKVKELTTLYGKLRKEVQLGEFGTEIDVSELNREIDKRVEFVLKHDGEGIIEFIMNSPKMIPNKEALVKYESDGLFKDVASSVIDIRGNTARHYHSTDEKNFEQLLFHYNLHIQIWYFPMIREVFLKSVLNGKLNIELVLKFLGEKTWYGQELGFASRKDVELKGKWLAQLAPSIIELFIAIDELVFSNRRPWNLVTIIDSMTVKIEGTLRSLAEYSDINTFIIKNDKSGRTISEEKDIMRLLTDEEMIKLIGEDDILYLRYLLTEKSGFNFRNKIAHGLMNYEDYTLGTALLIFFAILRLGRFQLKLND